MKNKYLIVGLYSLAYFVLLTIFQLLFFYFYKAIEEQLISFSYLSASIILLLFVYFFFRKYYTAPKNKIKPLKYYWLFILTAPLFYIFNFYFLKLFFYSNQTARLQDFKLIEDLSLILSTVIIVPIIEELLFRGIILNTLLLESKIKIIPILFTSLLFGLIHATSFDFNDLHRVLSAFCFSLIVSIFYVKTNNIYYVIWFHILYNLTWCIYR